MRSDQEIDLARRQPQRRPPAKGRVAVDVIGSQRLLEPFDPEWLELRSADALRSNQWAGYFHGMKVASLWGNPPVAKTFKQRLRAQLIDRFVYLDTMDFSDHSVADFIARWRREGAECVTKFALAKLALI